MPRNQMTKNEKASATDKAGVALYQEKQVVFEGAIPHPDILKGYGEIDKSYPERIIKLAENHAKTEDSSQSELAKNTKETKFSLPKGTSGKILVKSYVNGILNNSVKENYVAF